MFTSLLRTLRHPSLHRWIVCLCLSAALVAGGVGGWFYLSSSPPSLPPPMGAQAPFLVWSKNPSPLPNLVIRRLDGTDLHLSSFKGKPILINLWATWCAPCRREMPLLDQLQSFFPVSSFEVVTISLDRDPSRSIASFFQQRQLTHLTPYQDVQGGAFRLLKVRGLPTSILVDTEGREMARLEGETDWTSDPIKKMIESLIHIGDTRVIPST